MIVHGPPAASYRASTESERRTIAVAASTPASRRGTAALALDLATQAAEAALVADRASPTGSTRTAVLAHLLLPLVVGDAQTPSPPPAAAGGGGGSTPTSSPRTRPCFAAPRRRAAAAGRRGAGRRGPRSAGCPVTPYRSRAPPAWTPCPRAGRRRAGVVAPGRRRRPRPDGDVGRAAVHPLLADWGAQVVDGRAGTSAATGCAGHRAQFAVARRSGKRRVPWDLRGRDDRRRVRGRRSRRPTCSSSRSPTGSCRTSATRPTSSGGSTRDLRVDLDPGVPGAPESSWVAFGRGVHAASGLGMVDGVPTPALLAYPDPLAGLVAFAAVLRALGR